MRTVAGRLGHSGGGTTTLKVYSAWISDADQRARSLGMRMPDLPIEVDPATPITGRSLDDDENANQHRRITADLRGGIACGALRVRQDRT